MTIKNNNNKKQNKIVRSLWTLLPAISNRFDGWNIPVLSALLLSSLWLIKICVSVSKRI